MPKVSAFERFRGELTMQIKTMQLGMIGTNCYIFWDEDCRKCAIVDPGDHGERVADFIKNQNLEPVAIFLTHAHFDHILGIPGLRSVWPALPVYCHPADIDPSQKTVNMFGSTYPAISSFDNVLPYVDGDKGMVGSIEVEVISTPGHTPGSVTLKAADVLFTGDTLFRSSVGRTDLEGGSYSTLMVSLGKLGRLSGNYKVLPGHEAPSTLDEERQFNGYLAQAMGM